MSKRVQHNRPTKVAMYGDCELTTGGSASNSRIVTVHLPQETQLKTKRAQRSFRCANAHLSRSITICTMILVWDHSHGKQEQQDLVVCRPYAIPESYEEAEMVDSGWLALDRPIYHEGRLQECFYQSRSTRIQLKNYRAPKTEATHRGEKIQMMEIIPEEHNVEMTGLRHVYNRYIKRTRFRDIYDPFVSIQPRDSFLIYYVGDVTNILGFSKIKRYWFQEELLNYNNRREIRRIRPDQCYAMESVLHANTVPISRITVDMEASWAKKKGMSELYLGSGYERSSIYKSKFRGFQWWTGTMWSSDKKKYTRLCERDSSVKKISDLAT